MQISSLNDYPKSESFISYVPNSSSENSNIEEKIRTIVKAWLDFTKLDSSFDGQKKQIYASLAADFDKLDQEVIRSMAVSIPVKTLFQNTLKSVNSYSSGSFDKEIDADRIELMERLIFNKSDASPPVGTNLLPIAIETTIQMLSNPNQFALEDTLSNLLDKPSVDINKLQNDIKSALMEDGISGMLAKIQFLGAMANSDIIQKNLPSVLNDWHEHLKDFFPVSAQLIEDNLENWKKIKKSTDYYNQVLIPLIKTLPTLETSARQLFPLAFKLMDFSLASGPFPPVKRNYDFTYNSLLSDIQDIVLRTKKACGAVVFIDPVRVFSIVLEPTGQVLMADPYGFCCFRKEDEFSTFTFGLAQNIEDAQDLLYLHYDASTIEKGKSFYSIYALPLRYAFTPFDPLDFMITEEIIDVEECIEKTESFSHGDSIDKMKQKELLSELRLLLLRKIQGEKKIDALRIVLSLDTSIKEKWRKIYFKAKSEKDLLVALERLISQV
ncbi:MAG: hypothetical protein FJZ56_05375 [Chlamydiae bacterium]|nr:hypothetical protein [Chlamydiota bacterium]